MNKSLLEIYKSKFHTGLTCVITGESRFIFGCIHNIKDTIFKFITLLL